MRLVLLALALAVSPLLHAAEEKPAPVTTIADLPSPAGPRALGASFTTAPDGTVWLSWVEASAENLAAAAAKKSSPHQHGAAEPASATAAPKPANTLRFSTFDAAAKTWSAARTIASRPDIPLSSADFPLLAIDGRGTVTAVWTDGRGGALVSSSTDRGATWTSPAPWTRESDGVEKFAFVRLADGRVLAAWLDNRAIKTGTKLQRLYTRILGDSAPDTLVDPSVCDCCQTALTAFPDGGALLAYRGRTTEEVRDIRTARFRGKEWDEPRPLNNDNWRILACPMNGPRLASDGGRVAVAWFTAADNDPRVLASFSPDAGARFLLPLRLDRGKPAGHVDTLILRDGALLVTWLEADGSFWLRRITPDFAADEPVALAPAGTLSVKTNPRVTLLRDYIGGTAPVQFLATFATDSALRTLLVTVPEGDLLTAKGNCDCAPTPDQLVGYPIRGAVAALATDRGTLHIVHEELPGLLFAGTHEFHAAPSVLAAVQLGRRVFGRIEQRNGQWWLFDVRLAAGK
ncbi:MAG: sialidase family protein [Verrucomicrobia bacterium]|nr:sialidase family protein [Verrucomicrobiota bacterium]